MDGASKRRGRGRPTKNTQNDTDGTPSPQTVPPPQIIDDGDDTKRKQPLRRGRKAKVVIGAYDAAAACNTILGSEDAADNENIIVRLAVNPGTSTGATASPSTVPNAYNTHPNDYNTFQSVPLEFGRESTQGSCEANMREPIKTDPKSSVANNINASTTDPKLKVVELLKDFEMKSKNDEWPTSTSICCYWCCNPFNSVPFGIPVKYVDEKFHVFGCFCNLECAAAYNFHSGESHDEKWERYHLINLLSHKIGHADRVRASPSRLALKMFGGYMDLDEFRSFARTTTKVIGVNFPPMLTLTQQIEELNECDVSSEYKYIPIDIDRINKYREKIVLRRNKPVTEFRNTLDSLMNLKIHS